MKRTVFAAIAGVAAMASAAPAAAQGACTREQMNEIADGFVAGIEQGTPFTMQLGEWVDYQENFELSTMSGFFDEPRKVDWHLRLLDTTTCQVFVEAVMLDEKRPMVTATQLNNGFFGVSPIKNIVTEDGDWLWDPQYTYEYARREDWGDIPEGERHSRDELIAIANTYLDLFSDPTIEVPWGFPCNRLEGSIYSGEGKETDTCNVGVPSGVAMTNRQYVVDPVIGAVDVFLEMGANKRPDSHLFRIENGKIRFVHTVTNCLEDDNCGFEPFEEMLKNNPNMRPPFKD
jgi:hypothetical protein